jgi:hypothetical protein
MAHRVLSGVLGAAALVGWGMFAYSTSSSTSVERQLRLQVSDIWNDRARIIEERNALRSEVAGLQEAQTRLAAELASAKASAAEATQESEAAPVPAEQRASIREPEETASVTAPVLTPAEIEASIKTAQMVLTELGFGPLESDGVIGPQTRRAIRAFERKNGLPETGELVPRTVRAMRSAVEGANRTAGGTVQARP